jgi:hypothetical protein
MKLRTVLLSLALSTAAAQLNAAPITFTGFLTGPNEPPPNASPGTGTACVTIDDVAHTLRVQIVFSDLLAGVTAAHIHVINGHGDTDGQATLGPVATTTPTFTGFPLGVTSGSYDMTFNTTLASSYRAQFITDGGGTTAAAEAALFAGIVEGRAYLNIHTTQFTGGEIRDFLEPVPEPETAFLVAAALAIRGRWRHYVK